MTNLRVLGSDDETSVWVEAAETHFVEAFDVLADTLNGLSVSIDASPDRLPTRGRKASGNDIADITKLLLLTFMGHGIDKGSASARVAKIENVLWYGNIREADEGTDRSRSSAILKRVDRRRIHSPA